MDKQVKLFKEITLQQKQYSVHLWTQYHECLLKDDNIASWNYWNKRMDFLLEIGIEEPQTSFVNLVKIH